MKNALRSITLLLVVLMLAAFCMTSCDGIFDSILGTEEPPVDGGTGDGTGDGEGEDDPDPIIYTLVLKASKTEATRGDKITLTASLKSGEGEEPASEDVEYIIEEGAEYASLVGNTLTVKDNANHGATIKVKAREGATDSNLVEITVNVPASSIEISANGVKNLLAGSSVVLTSTISPEGASSAISYVITEGSDYSTISGNVLVVDSGAVTGKTIKVKAVSGTVESNELSFTVGYPLNTISISSDVTNIVSGSFAQLYVNVDPENTTSEYAWEFVKGGEYAIVVNGVLSVKANAPTGAEIVLRAVSGNISSNELSFTVGYPLEKITVTTNATNIVSGSMAQLGVDIYPENATNGKYTWEFIEGGEYATVVNNVISVNANAPTGAKILVKAVSEGGISSNTVEFTVGYPLEKITVTTNVENIVSGSMAQLGVDIYPENATNGKYTWEFIEGGEYATVVNNVISVNANAPTGAKIALRAVSEGGIVSNVVEFTVGYPLTSLNASLVGSSSNINNGSSAQLSVSLTPANATNGQYVWEFVEGADFASITGDIITINNDAPVGSIIKIVAVAGTIRSNEITIMAGTPIDKIQISTDAPEILDRGEKYPLSVSVTPTGATTDAITWVVSEGGEYVSVVSNLLSVSKNTPAGTKVKVYASSGSVTSNILEFTVGVVLEKIDITLIGSENVDPNTSRDITHVLTPTNASDTTVTWVIDSGAEYASIVNGRVVVNANAPVGEKVTFHAEIGEVKSNALTITVGVPAESIEISLVGSANVDPEASRTLSYVLGPTNATLVPVTWVIDSGAEYVSIVNNVLFVDAEAPVGAKVTFHAEIGEVKSNALTITVGTPIETIAIEATGSHEVVKGNSVGLLATVTPGKAQASLVNWVITEGEEFATIKGTTLVVNSTATTGATIKVKAVWGTVESNELEFTVMATQEEINAAKYFLDLNTSNIRVDKNGTSSPTLIAEILNGNYEKVENMDIEFTVLEGAEYLGIVPNGSKCTFTALGHGEAVVEVTIKGVENVSETVTVEVIVPPESISVPEVFAERRGFDYAFSMVNPITGDAEALPFAPIIRGGALVCQELSFTFLHESGATGSEVAEYIDGNLVFHKTGKVTVTVTSASGSRLEAATSYVFNINEGYNANTFEELSYIVESDFYQGQLPINLVILEKPNGSATNYEYGYDMVPSMALLPHSEQTIAQMIRGYATYEGKWVNVRIQAVNKGLWINGNNHKLDVSQLKVFTRAEYDAYTTEYGVTDYYPRFSSFLSAETWYNEGVDDPDFVEASYYIRLYDFELKGNAPVTYNPADYNVGYEDSNIFVGAFDKGLSIGNYQYNTHYYIDANNLTASCFMNGLAFTNIVGNGKISNLHVYNCYSTGLVTRSSIVTIENLKIGICGATGIELAPEDSDAAGINGNEKAQVTISGTVDASTNLNDGNTNYFQNYSISGATVPQIITGNTQMYHENQVAHIRNENGQFIFVSLLFYNLEKLLPNYSIVDYPAYQEGGIINIADLPTSGVDTTHQFIRMDIYVTLPGATQPQLVGIAYFYNHNYGK